MNKTSPSVKLEVQRPNIKIPTIIKPVFLVQLTPRPRRKKTRQLCGLAVNPHTNRCRGRNWAYGNQALAETSKGSLKLNNIMHKCLILKYQY